MVIDLTSFGNHGNNSKKNEKANFTIKLKPKLGEERNFFLFLHAVT